MNGRSDQRLKFQHRVPVSLFYDTILASHCFSKIKWQSCGCRGEDSYAAEK
jgi:hypothetical protein